MSGPLCGIEKEDEEKKIGDAIIGICSSRCGGLRFVYHVNTSTDPSSNGIGVLFLVEHKTCTFYGKANITYLYGQPLDVMGVLLSPINSGPYPAFSPSTHAALTFIRAGATDHSIEQESNLGETLRSVLKHDLPSITSLLDTVLSQQQKMGARYSVVLFESLSCRISDSIQKVKKFSSLYSLMHPGSIPKEPSVLRALGFSFTDTDTDGFRSSPHMLTLSDKFNTAIREFYSTKILLAGPKGAGKSSLLRFIINRSITYSSFCESGKNPQTVAVLDCDVGQPEFTPCGMISLTIVSKPIMGPPFTHQILKSSRTICQCFVGSITPSEDPNFYLKCLEYVYGAYNNLPEPKPPLIVNTMGWTQGLGLALLVEQIALIKPNIVAQIQLSPKQPSARQNLPILDRTTLQSLQGWNSRDLSLEEFNHEVFTVPCMAYPTDGSSNASLRSRFGAPDHRDLTLLAYFTAGLADAPTSLPPRPKTSSLGHPVAHFLDCLPYHVPVASPITDEASTNGTGTHEPASANETAEHPEAVANPFRLAVCLMGSTSNLFGTPVNWLPLTVETIMACINATIVALCAVPPDAIQKPDNSRTCAIVPSNPICECLGLAICRAVDSRAGLLYLTTGVPAEQLMKVTAVVRGKVDLPACFFLEQPIPFTPEEGPPPTELPYTGPAETQGIGRVGLPSRRPYPRTAHHQFHRTGSSDSWDRR